MLEKNL